MLSEEIVLSQKDATILKKQKSKTIISATEQSFKIQKKEIIQLPVTIVGSGYYIPQKKIDNMYYEKKFGIPHQKIKRLTGIDTRFFAHEDEECSDLASNAIDIMFQRTPIKREDVDIIIFSSMGGDYSSPPTACIIQKKQRLFNASAFDIIGSCTSFLQSFQIASMYLKTGYAKTILLVSADVPSRGSNPNDADTRILFGDGAGCILVQKEEAMKKGIVSQVFGTDGNNWDVTTILGGGTTYPVPTSKVGDRIWFRMDGKRLYRIAIDRLWPAILKVLDDANITMEQIKLIVPHQANHRIIQTLLRRMGVSESKMALTINEYGNTATSSMVITLSKYLQKGIMKNGEYLLLIGFGAGFSWGVILLKC